MNSKEQLLKELQSLEFAMTDLGLYLDSHPNCKEGLCYYKQLKNQHDTLRCSYEERFGPLQPGGGENTDYWDWVATPWPWEL